MGMNTIIISENGSNTHYVRTNHSLETPLEEIAQAGHKLALHIGFGGASGAKVRVYRRAVNTPMSEPDGEFRVERINAARHILTAVA